MTTSNNKSGCLVLASKLARYGNFIFHTFNQGNLNADKYEGLVKVFNENIDKNHF